MTQILDKSLIKQQEKTTEPNNEPTEEYEDYAEIDFDDASN
jgi:hypothetical protein